MRLGSVTAVVDDSDQQLDGVTLHGLQLLDVLVEAAIAVDQHYLAVVLRRGDNRSRPTGPNRSHRNRIGMWYLPAGRSRRCVIAKLGQCPPATIMSQSFGMAGSSSLTTGRGSSVSGAGV